MDLKKILSWGAFAIGFVLIFCGWFLWGNREDTAVFTLNLIVSLGVYSLLFSDFLISWYDPEDKSQRRIGNLGLKWAVMWIYALLAIFVIALTILFGWVFWVALFVQGIALMVLVAGFALSTHSASQIGGIQAKQDAERSYVEQMRRDLKGLHYDMLDKGSVPAELSQRVERLIEEMRFISPSNSEDARDLEKRFLDIVDRARLMVSSFSASNEELAAEISKIERTLKDRKSVYSN